MNSVYYVASNTLTGNQMDKAGFAGAVVEGVVIGTGLVQLLGGKYCRNRSKKKSCLTSPQIL